MNEIELTKRLRQIQDLVEVCLSGISTGQKPIEKKGPRKISVSKTTTVDKGGVDFSIPIRPFVKKYAADMSGPKKFTLILARLSSGELKKEIDLTEIDRVWNGMTAILGMKFNRFYSQTAKDNDWVISEKKGAYSLRPSWLEIFN